jgi:ABC-2 type transport system ATP-binding protein
VEETDTQVNSQINDTWVPSFRVDWANWESEGHIDVYLHIDGILMNDFRYAYSWQVPNGTAFWASGFNHSPAFAFFAPFEATFIITCTALSPDGIIKSVSGTIEVGKLGSKSLKAKRELIAQAETAIDVQDVSMVFNIASEQFNSLKEYFIAASKHELKFKAFRALDHVSFEVKRGEAFGLIGTNGSGKSTMLKIIAGVLEASEGTCTVRGTIAPLIELGAGFDMDLTAKENIYLNGALLGYQREFIDDHFDDIVSFAELDGFLEMPLKNYSSGMVARIAFAIATAAEPDILIVDETLSVGDFIFQRKCENRIQEMISGGNVTVLLVSHSIDLIENICDRVCWIEKGRMRMVGPTLDVCRAYRDSGL